MPFDLNSLGLGALSNASQREDWLRSLARAHATFFGAPVDTVNAGMGLLGLPVSSSPVMGSQWIAENTGAPRKPGSPYADFAVGLLAQPVAQVVGMGAGLLSDAVMSSKRGPVPGGPASQEGAWKLFTQDPSSGRAKNIGEGPFDKGGDALNFTKAEVGSPVAVREDGARNFRIHIMGDNGKYHDSGEGPFKSMRDALDFINSEVGSPAYAISKKKR